MISTRTVQSSLGSGDNLEHTRRLACQQGTQHHVTGTRDLAPGNPLISRGLGEKLRFLVLHRVSCVTSHITGGSSSLSLSPLSLQLPRIVSRRDKATLSPSIFSQVLPLIEISLGAFVRAEPAMKWGLHGLPTCLHPIKYLVTNRINHLLGGPVFAELITQKRPGCRIICRISKLRIQKELKGRILHLMEIAVSTKTFSLYFFCLNI